ncbi:MAG: hypothetical protein RIR70_2005, partial [Pseudomonadota bacterium]
SDTTSPVQSACQKNAKPPLGIGNTLPTCWGWGSFDAPALLDAPRRKWNLWHQSTSKLFLRDNPRESKDEMNTPPNALIRISRSASTHQNSPLNHEITGDRDRLLPAGGTDEYGACFCASASEMADAAGDYAWWFAGVLNKQLTKLQRHVHYTFFASENERKAFGEYRATLARFAQSPLSKSPTISVKCAIKSFEDCLSKLESAGYDGPLPLERHPLARFIANERAKEQLGAPQGTALIMRKKANC